MLPYLGSVFMLHRTAPYEKGNFLFNEDLKVSPEKLDETIRELKRMKRVFISLDDVPEVLREPKSSKFKYAVITLDDGYKDNLEYGYDIFKKHDVPFCLYVTNSFPNRTTNLWWYALENLILQNDSLSMPEDGQIKNNTISQKRNNFLKVRRQILDHHFKNPVDFLRQLGKLDFDLATAHEQMCLTWNEIRELSNDPLVTIGCHTMNHYPLSKLTHAEVEYEIGQSRRELENELQKKINHFAFPFGSLLEANTREYQIAKSFLFDTITTTIHGHIGKTDNPHELSRIFLHSFQNNATSIQRLMYWNLKSLHYFGKNFLKSI